MQRLATRLLLAAAVGTAVAGGATQPAVASSAATRTPVVVIKTSNLGKVVATTGKLGLYTWDVERKAGGKVRCTGACAKAWPPVIVKGPVQRHVAGIKATFGTVKRPGGKTQLTVNGLPAYTYRHDTPNIVLCDNVDGWFAVRAR
jgi:predicted lipoprotein with Yx(FWY)xxD motif